MWTCRRALCVSTLFPSFPESSHLLPLSGTIMTSTPQIDAEYDIVIAGGKSLSELTSWPHSLLSFSRWCSGLSARRAPRCRLADPDHPRPRSGAPHARAPRAHPARAVPLAPRADVDDRAVPQGGEEGGAGRARARRAVRAVFRWGVER